MPKSRIKMSGDMFAGLSNPVKKDNIPKKNEAPKKQIIDSVDQSAEIVKVAAKEPKFEANNEDILNKMKALEEELQREKSRRKSLEEIKSFKRSRFEDFEVLAARVTKDQKAGFQALSRQIKANKDAYERITGNSLLRGLLEAFLKRAENLNLDSYYSDKDVYDDIEKLFK